jgi:hypothetical protein
MPGEIGEIGEFFTVNKLASIIEGLLSQGDNQLKVSVADKLLLTIPEAQNSYFVECKAESIDFSLFTS